MKNFVYCIDKNFNNQAFLSMSSLLQSTSEKLQIYVIHKNPSTFKKFEKKIYNNFSNCTLKKIKFKYNIKNYPNLKKSHVSEATYYRLFIADHIDDDIDYITYLDADTYILKSPIQKINKHINIMKDSGKILTALTTNKYEDLETKDMFERLGIDKKYFNGGVMVIDLVNWKKQKITDKFITVKNTLLEKIVYWDQDILNRYFDGEYENLDKNLNYLVNLSLDKKIKEEILIFHFVGKDKPWNVDMTDNDFKNFYDNLYKHYL